MSNTTTLTHPIDYVRGRRWTRMEPAPAPYCPWPRIDEAAAPATYIPQDLHLI